MDGKPKRRAARRKALKRARLMRILPWLAAVILIVAGFLSLPHLLRPGVDMPAMADAPSAMKTAPAGTVAPPAETDAPAATMAPSVETDLPSGTVASPFGTAVPEEAVVTPSVSPASLPVRITISAAGDCTLGGDASGRSYSAFANVYRKNGAAYFLKNVRDIFAEDDLTIVNLEGPLTKAKKFREKEFAFKGNPEYVKILTEGSVEAANLANNHAKDYLNQGLSDTAAVLKKAGIARFGWGKTEILDIKGVKVGLAGFGVWYGSVKSMEKQIKALKKESDLVIVSIHGGEEGEGRALKVQRDYARAAVRAGASLVLGHHPHVVGGIEVYRGATIVYSLANFCFGGNMNPGDKDTFIFQQTFEVGPDGPVPAGELVIPCSVSGKKDRNDYQPVPLTGSAAERVLGRIEKLSKGFDQPVDLTASRERLNVG